MENLEKARWSDIPADIFNIIASKSANTIDELTHFCSIDPSWYRRLPVPRLPYPQKPILILPPRPGIDQSLPINTVVKIPPMDMHPAEDAPFQSLPHPKYVNGSVQIGSSFGWLITLDLDSCISLVNPLTGAVRTLPPLNRLDQEIVVFDPDAYPPYFIKKSHTKHTEISIAHVAVLSADPATDPDFLLLLFITDITNCCFTCCGSKGTWSHHPHPPFIVEDVTAFDKKFFAFDKTPRLAVFMFAQDDMNMRVYPIDMGGCPIERANLVVAKGELGLFVKVQNPPRLAAHRCLDRWVPIKRRYGLYTLHSKSEEGMESYEAKKITEPRDEAWFVGKGCSVAVESCLLRGLEAGNVYYCCSRATDRTEMISAGKNRFATKYMVVVFRYEIKTGERMRVASAYSTAFADSCGEPVPYLVSPNLNE